MFTPSEAEQPEPRTRGKMLCCRLFAVLSVTVLTLLRAVSSCDTTCTEKTYFIPSRLVVKHGSSISATCHLCPSCQNNYFDLEISVGNRSVNGTMISWTVNRMTEWGTSALCHYYNLVTLKQCCSSLPVTVYKPPDSVSISLKNHSGQMYEAHEYTLQCEVHNVAPARCVSVTFYRGETPLERLQSESPSIRGLKNEPPENLVFFLNINTTKEDDGAQYWCETRLELGPEGPQHPPVMASQNMTATVHYKPQRQEPSPRDPIIVSKGDTLQLNCMAEGNPRPSYNWRILPANRLLSNSSILTITSVAFENQGHYICFVSNDVGTLSVNFNVVVKANIIPYIVICVVITIGIVVGIAIYWYRHNRIGQYDLWKVSCFQKAHVAVPSAE